MTRAERSPRKRARSQMKHVWFIGDKGKEEEGEREEVASRRGSDETESEGNRLAVCWISFFPLEKIFHFSAFRLSLLSPLPLLRGWIRDDARGRREKKSFPSSLSFRFYVRTAYSRRTRRAAPLFVLSFVKLDERSRLERRPFPFVSFFFFLPACRCRRTSRHRLRGLSNDALLPHLRRQTRETTRENLSKLDGGRMREIPPWNHRDSPFQIRNFFGIKLRGENARGALIFRCLDL